MRDSIRKTVIVVNKPNDDFTHYDARIHLKRVTRHNVTLRATAHRQNRLVGAGSEHTTTNLSAWRMNQETDIEALQAQIDLSNSVAFDIVSSWMKPSTSSSSSSSKPVQQQPVVPRTTTRDLEEFARRPPRLGLGATVSKSTTVTAQEAAKLKGKLSRKPIRGDNGDVAADSSKKRKNDDDEDEDEEESRNTVISQRKSTTAGLNKRVIDVFASTSNKKRKRSNSHSEGSTMLNKTDPVNVTLPPVHISPPSKSKKRKDKGKGKNKLNQGEEDDASSTAVFDEEWTGFSEEVYDGVVVPDGPPSTPSPPPSLSSSSSKSHTRRVSSLSPISRPSLYRGFSVDNQKVSLLNLHGPPPPPIQVEEGDKSSTVGSSDKKKRRRKRKKRKSDQTQVIGGGSGDT